MSTPEAAATSPDNPLAALLKTNNVFLFVPNIIGYARVFLAVVSLWFMPTQYEVSAFCYVLSGLLDALDGHAARALNQSTKFGAMLDMITDRCATMALLATLCTFYPSWAFVFQLSMIIDISCHWIHLHTSLLQGRTSHKFIDAGEHPLMRLYYTSRPVLFAMCAGNELFYSSLYLLHFTDGPFYIFRLLAVLCFPVAVAKSAIALLQGYLACLNLAAIDTEDRQRNLEEKKN